MIIIIFVISVTFLIPYYNMCIEFDGRQHFEPWRLKNTEEAINKLIKIQKNDEIKNKFCRDNKILLLRIKFDENIPDKINQFLNENK